jgi:hypothetical protein
LEAQTVSKDAKKRSQDALSAIDGEGTSESEGRSEGERRSESEGKPESEERFANPRIRSQREG